MVADRWFLALQLLAVGYFPSDADGRIRKSRAGSMDQPPKIDCYRRHSSLHSNANNIVRPSSIELLNEKAPTATVLKMNNNIAIAEDAREAASPAPIKLGWVQGVFVRCVLSILGVMLYLRISWVAGQAGLCNKV